VPVIPLLAADPSSSAVVDGFGLLVTALVLGFRHGIDWDHIAAITDITSTTAAADAATGRHEDEHAHLGPLHEHGHGGPGEIRAHGAGPAAASAPAPLPAATGDLVIRGPRVASEQRHAIILGTLYALGHALVVSLLGLAALAFGAVLPDWVDPIMGRVVGATLLLLGVWVFVSLYQYARYGTEFRLRSRWMIVFASARHAWRRLQARLHGHEHVAPIEMSSYGPRTAFLVGMVHGIGAETGTQVLIIAAVGGAAAAGLGLPMMVAFVVGLLVSNSLIVLLTATGFVASQARRQIYLAVGVIAGVFSVAIGALFLFQAEGALPELDRIFGALPR